MQLATLAKFVNLIINKFANLQIICIFAPNYINEHLGSTGFDSK